jgi:hypothetical protein
MIQNEQEIKDLQIESTEFVKEDLDFIKKNEEEIKDLQLGVLRNSDITISKEDEILLNQIEQFQRNEINQHSLLNQIKQMQNTIEEIKNISLGNDNGNQNTTRKRSNSFDDIQPKKTPQPEKRNGKRRRRRKNYDTNWKENLKYEIIIAARDCWNTNDLNIRLSKLSNKGKALNFEIMPIELTNDDPLDQMIDNNKFPPIDDWFCPICGERLCTRNNDNLELWDIHLAASIFWTISITTIYINFFFMEQPLQITRCLNKNKKKTKG